MNRSLPKLLVLGGAASAVLLCTTFGLSMQANASELYCSYGTKTDLMLKDLKSAGRTYYESEISTLDLSQLNFLLALSSNKQKCFTTFGKAQLNKQPGILLKSTTSNGLQVEAFCKDEILSDCKIRINENPLLSKWKDGSISAVRIGVDAYIYTISYKTDATKLFSFIAPSPSQITGQMTQP
jgi:hypothetical protein